MVLNHKKSHYIRIGKNTDQECFKMEDLWLAKSKEEEILHTTIENKVNFNTHMKKINRKAAQKVSVLCRIVGHIDNDNRVFLFSSDIRSQFSYCLLMSIFC